jgi:hypothetical protein
LDNAAGEGAKTWILKLIAMHCHSRVATGVYTNGYGKIL